MKRILGLTIAALLVIAMVGGATWAYFSDSESTVDNTFTAGTLDLTRDTFSEVTDAFLTDVEVGNVAPGDSSSDYSTLANGGTLSGELDINLGSVVETDVDSGEFDGDPDLADNLYMAIWLDEDNEGGWEDGDVGLEASTNTKYGYVGGVSSTSTGAGSTTTLVDSALTEADDHWNGFKITITSGANDTLLGVVTDFDAASDTLTVTAFPNAIASGVDYTLSGPLYATMASYHNLGEYDDVLTVAKNGDPGDDWDFTAEWLVPATVGNTIQGDTSKFDTITFTLEQAAAD